MPCIVNLIALHRPQEKKAIKRLAYFAQLLATLAILAISQACRRASGYQGQIILRIHIAYSFFCIPRCLWPLDRFKGNQFNEDRLKEGRLYVPIPHTASFILHQNVPCISLSMSCEARTNDTRDCINQHATMSL
jgi:hypothetical protein